MRHCRWIQSHAAMAIARDRCSSGCMVSAPLHEPIVGCGGKPSPWSQDLRALVRRVRAGDLVRGHFIIALNIEHVIRFAPCASRIAGCCLMITSKRLRLLMCLQKSSFTRGERAGVRSVGTGLLGFFGERLLATQLRNAFVGFGCQVSNNE
jgi:hypothetical protein